METGVSQLHMFGRQQMKAAESWSHGARFDAPSHWLSPDFPSPSPPAALVAAFLSLFGEEVVIHTEDII